MDRGPWQATVHGVAKKQLSSSSGGKVTLELSGCVKLG